MRRTIQSSLLGYLALAAAVTLAPCDEPILTESLPNGARLILQSRPGCGTYAFQILALGGQLEDPDGQLGMTDVLSRMLLRGSLTRTGLDQAIGFEQTGSTVECSGGTLGFSLRAQGPAGALAAVLPIAVDAMLNPRLDPEDLKTEIDLARLRLTRSLDNPSSARQRTMLPLLFGLHPMGRVPQPDDYLTGLTPEVIRRTHRQRVAGARLIIVFVGEFDTAAVRDQLAASFGDLPAGTPPVPPAAPAPLASDRRARAKRRTSQPEIVVALPTAGLHEREEPVMDYLSHLLTGFQERLSAEIREKRGWAYWLAPLDWRLPGAGAFGIVTAVPGRHLRETERLIHEELERMASVAPSDVEMERARRFLLTARARAWQQSAARATRYAADAARGLPARDYPDDAASLASVTPEEVRDLARKLLDRSATVTVTLY